MKKIFFLFGFLALSSSALAQEKNIVLSASSTSSSPDSTPVTCLLDANCKGSWSPKTLDAGSNEGLYVQFENPLSFDYVEIAYSGKNNPDFLLYINGQTNRSINGFTNAYPGSDTSGNFNVTQFAIGRSEASPLKAQAKSVFLKINRYWDYSSDPKPPKIFWIKFFKYAQAPQNYLYKQQAALPLVLPKLVPASITATSILEPQFAYHPAHLVDSKLDFSWATDGKKSAGLGDSFKIHFNTPQNLSGMILWNGYQRSESHFKANSRVTQAEVKSQSGQTANLNIQDVSGAQKLNFQTPLNAVTDLTFTLKALASGLSYKDVVISEIRFIDDQGNYILPQANLPAPSIPTEMQGIVDRTFASFLDQPMQGDSICPQVECDHKIYNQSLRLRSDGSFVIYKGLQGKKADSIDSPQDERSQVLEGNWEYSAGKIRLFGKRYTTALVSSEYLKEKKTTSPIATIFSTELGFKRFNDMSEPEQKKLLDTLWISKGGPAVKKEGQSWANLFCEPENNLMTEVHKKIKSLNSYYFNSSVLNDLLLNEGRDSLSCS